jgi:hypothetical protein
MNEGRRGQLVSNFVPLRPIPWAECRSRRVVGVRPRRVSSIASPRGHRQPCPNLRILLPPGACCRPRPVCLQPCRSRTSPRQPPTSGPRPRRAGKVCRRSGPLRCAAPPSFPSRRGPHPSLHRRPRRRRRLPRTVPCGMALHLAQPRPPPRRRGGRTRRPQHRRPRPPRHGPPRRPSRPRRSGPNPRLSHGHRHRRPPRDRQRRPNAGPIRPARTTRAWRRCTDHRRCHSRPSIV